MLFLQTPWVLLGVRGELCPSDAMGEHRPEATAREEGWPVEVATGKHRSVEAERGVHVASEGATAPSESGSSAHAAIRTCMIAFRRPIALDTIRSCGNNEGRDSAPTSKWLQFRTLPHPHAHLQLWVRL